MGQAYHPPPTLNLGIFGREDPFVHFQLKPISIFMGKPLFDLLNNNFKLVRLAFILCQTLNTLKFENQYELLINAWTSHVNEMLLQIG